MNISLVKDDFKLLDGTFLQVNFENGFEFMDNIGKIITYIQKQNPQTKISEFSINQEQTMLSIKSPFVFCNEIKIGWTLIWMSLKEEYKFSEIEPIIKKIFDIIGIDKANRVAIRSKFVTEKDINIMSFLSLKNVSGKCNISFEANFDTLTANIGLLQLLKDYKKESGFLIDMDLFRASDNMAIKEIMDLFKKIDKETQEKNFIKLFL